MTTTVETIVEAHTTSAGKLALKVSQGDLKSSKYIVGEYTFYVIAVRRSEWTWNKAVREFEPAPSLVVDTWKRTGNIETARREIAKARGCGQDVFLLHRGRDGVYSVSQKLFASR